MQSLKSSVIIFLPTSTKAEILQQVWEYCVVIYAIKSEATLSLLGDETKVSWGGGWNPNFFYSCLSWEIVIKISKKLSEKCYCLSRKIVTKKEN